MEQATYNATLNRPRRAIALISGGLDSAIAAQLVTQWGIEVIGLHLVSPFGCTTDAQKVADHLNIRLVLKEKGNDYLDIVENPKYGYGRNMNPCIDCRIYMFELAEQVLLEEKADFIVTGEVVGQRPLSQNKAAISLIEKKSPLIHKILRPLSGGNLPETLPEERGWIKREDLLKISGRGRTQQFLLAQQLGISEYASPSGGCLLTEGAFSDRLRDFFSHPTFATETEKLAQAEMLKLGRHFRISENAKVIVARTEGECQAVELLWQKSKGILLQPENFKGPLGIALGNLTETEKIQAGAILVRYGKKAECGPFQIKSHRLGVAEIFTVAEAASDEIINSWRVGIT